MKVVENGVEKRWSILHTSTQEKETVRSSTLGTRLRDKLLANVNEVHHPGSRVKQATLLRSYHFTPVNHFSTQCL
jgi:hypothetical protein